MDVVEEILKKNGNLDNYRPLTVDKYVEIDMGALLVVDNNILDQQSLSSNLNDYLLKLTRDNTQLLFNQVFELPTERIDEAIVAKLPKRRFKLPRFKPVPKPKPPTKWQQFAKEKGITKTKKDKLSWDEQLQKWIPLYGFKKAKADQDKEWLVEVPQNADPMEDQFAKKMTAKSENVAKNELQRLRNIAKARNVKVPRFGVGNPDSASAKELQTAVTVARASTASLGNFQEKLPKEKDATGIKPILPSSSRKRKLQPQITSKEEKTENLSILDSVLNKKPKINIEKAVNKQIAKTTNTEKSKKASKKKRPPPKKGKGKKIVGGRKRR